MAKSAHLFPVLTNQDGDRKKQNSEQLGAEVHS